MTACHGVGREPGDGKALLIISARPSATRFTGSDIIFSLSRGFARPAEAWRLHPVAIDMSPAKAGSEFHLYIFTSGSAARGAASRTLWVCRPFHGLLIQAGTCPRNSNIFHFSFFSRLRFAGHGEVPFHQSMHPKSFRHIRCRRLCA